MVIADASQDMKHEAIHTKPVGNHFDLVSTKYKPKECCVRMPFTKAK
jgi:hypothetical protein